MKQHQDPVEAVRSKLNEIPEKDAFGNNSRFQDQFFTWLAGGMVESAKDPNVRRLGYALRRGAEKSFSDLLAQKIAEKIDKFLSNGSPYYGRI